MDRRVLALDTATRRATVALCEGETILAEHAREVTTHSEGLLALVQRVLDESCLTADRLDGVACGRGPGSFTGLRIGLATAKGLCLAADLPLVCLSSLLPLARAAAPAAGQRAVLAVLDARRGEVFSGLFRAGAAAGSEQVWPPEELGRRAPHEPLVLAGDGALLHRELLLRSLGPRAELAPDGCHRIEARELCLAALPRLAAGEVDDLERAVPLYIRPSDARLPAIPQDRRPALS